MICKNCGAQLEENIQFCGNCGAPTAEATPVVNSAPAATPVVNSAPAATPIPQTVVNVATENAKKLKNVKKYINLETIVGFVFIIIGIIRALTSSASVSPTSFGADFYTYSYKAIVNCAELLSSVNVTLSIILIAIGCVIIFNSKRKD